MAHHPFRAPGHLQLILVYELSLSGGGRLWQDRTHPSTGKDATLWGGGGDPGLVNFLQRLSEDARRRQRALASEWGWAVDMGLTSWTFPSCCSSLLTVLHF